MIDHHAKSPCNQAQLRGSRKRRIKGLHRAKIAAIQRKTTRKELIHQSLLRELDGPGLAKSDTTEPADVLARVGSADAAAAGLRPQGHDVRECSPPSPIPAEKELPYYRHPKTGFLVSRRLNDPGFVPPTAEESQAMIERANEEEDLRRAGLLR